MLQDSQIHLPSYAGQGLSKLALTWPETHQYQKAYAAIVAETGLFIKESRDDPDEGFDANLSFMDAGLDSLDVLKV